MRQALESLIKSIGWHVRAYASAQDFLATDKLDAPGCLVLDVRLPGLSGLDLQQALVKMKRHIPIIFITGHGDIPMSVHAMKGGAGSERCGSLNDILSLRWQARNAATEPTARP